ncbi:hypothetical protein ACI77J_14685 [Pseudomonas sp. O64]|uniref:hypothetical protein n=1 Tax=unclassified Pseudomonas TaxID=196821 RepID=UPI00387B8783
MDKYVLDIYLGEIESQSLMAINAANALDRLAAISLEQWKAMSFEQRVEINKEYFRSVHSFLTHLSNISRLIWPPALSPKQNCFCGKPRAMDLTCGTCVARMRSTEILNALDILEPEHILKNRTLRDHLEHFDERLDKWMQTSKRRCYVQDNIGPLGAIQGLDQVDMMRNYDPTTGSFSFRGETYSLVDLFAGLQDVLSRTRGATAASKAL